MRALWIARTLPMEVSHRSGRRPRRLAHRRRASPRAAYQYELKSRKPGVDTEARWVRKGRHYRYGYKKHVLTDEQGLVESVITTPANCADTVVLPELIEKAELTQGVSVLADKGLL